MSDQINQSIEQIRRSLEGVEAAIELADTLETVELFRQEAVVEILCEVETLVGKIALLRTAELTDEDKVFQETVELVDEVVSTNSFEKENQVVDIIDLDSEVDADDFELSEELIEEELGEVEPIVQFPSLMDRINKFTSPNTHKYDEVTIFSAVKEVEKIPAETRSPEQQQTIDDFEFVSKFCSSPERMFKYTYTTEEIHTLAEALRVFSQKNRPDFNGVEMDVLDVVRGRTTYLGDNRGLHELIRRAESDEEGRVGMQWATLKEKSRIASARLRDTSLTKSEERKEYLIPAVDPEASGKGKTNDLTDVYQFIFDHFAHNVMSARALAVDKVNQEAFVGNVTIIKSYMKEFSELFDELPEDLIMDVSFGSHGQTRKYKPREYIDWLIGVMDERHANDKVGQGMTKGYRLDTSAALKLQYRIAHFMNDLNKFLVARTGGEVSVILDEDLTEEL